MSVSTVDRGLSDRLGAGAGKERRPGDARWSRRVAGDIVAALDILLIMLAVSASAWLHQGPRAFDGDKATAGLEICLLTAAVAHFIFQQMRHYEEARVPRLVVHPGGIALALFLAFAMVQAVAVALGVAEEFPRTWQLVGFLLAVPAVWLGRLAERACLTAYARRGLFDLNLAIFGSGRIARQIRDHLVREPEAMTLVGVYDDRADPVRVQRLGIGLSGGLDELIEAGRADRVDEIIIALPQSADVRITEIARRLEHLPVRIRVCTHIASDLVDAEPGRLRVSSLGPVGLLDLKSKPLKDWAPVVKRIEDLIVGSLALVVFAPVFLIAAIAVKLDSKGPVLFRQKRHGLNHRVIEVLKFRTMRVMEDGAAVRQATRGDPRVTRVGRILRKTSLDELPQLVNILRGDMSLVGPRPHAIVHNEQYGEMLERYANRHQVKPGLTGWAQVNGYRGETQTPEDMRKRVEYDLAYIDNWSLWFDLRILAATPFYGFTHKNAF